MPDHSHTLREAADELGLPLSTIRQWSKREDAPVTRQGPGKPVLCDADELATYADEHGLTGAPGRPRQPRDQNDEDADYWLMRWRRAKALREEGAVISKDEHFRIVSKLASTAAAKLEDVTALAPSLVGMSATEIRETLDQTIGSIRGYLADPQNYSID